MRAAHDLPLVSEAEYLAFVEINLPPADALSLAEIYHRIQWDKAPGGQGP